MWGKKKKADEHTGFMGDMSEEQEKQLEVFRKYIKDNNITDHP